MMRGVSSLQQRRQLRDLSLTPGARKVRAGLLALLGILHAAATLGFVLGSHRVGKLLEDPPGFGEPHSFAIEAYLVPALAPALVAITAWWALRGGFGRGLLASVLAAVTSFGLLIAWLAVHLFASTLSDRAEQAALACLLLAMPLGLVTLIVEPILYVRARRALEREDPVFPTARVVRRQRQTP